MREIILIVKDMKPDIVMITEVKPKYSLCEVSSQQFKLDGFDLFSNVEDKDVGRGVSIYIADHLTTRVNQINIGIANRDSI